MSGVESGPRGGGGGRWMGKADQTRNLKEVLSRNGKDSAQKLEMIGAPIDVYVFKMILPARLKFT